VLQQAHALRILPNGTFRHRMFGLTGL
jgi:hypothetical protein